MMPVAADAGTLKNRPGLALAYANVKSLSPNMSPTVFQALQAAVASKDCPIVVETGIGISTYHLCDGLRASGGTYIGIEHNWNWFEIVETWIRRLLTAHARDTAVSQRRIVGSLQPRYYPSPLLYVDSSFHAGPLTVHLHLRQAVGLTGDGTPEEFHEYLEAFDEPGDVVVVDGRARVPTLERVARTELVRPGGLLLLHDAWKYRDAARALFAGGTFLEGRGGLHNALLSDRRAQGRVVDEAYCWVAPR